jgi:hypothetical protein
MASESIRRQDASGHLPLCVWRNGDLVGAVETVEDGRELIAKFVAAGERETSFEVLVPCHLHPTSSAVDCLDCEPA